MLFFNSNEFQFVLILTAKSCVPLCSAFYSHIIYILRSIISIGCQHLHHQHCVPKTQVWKYENHDQSLFQGDDPGINNQKTPTVLLLTPEVRFQHSHFKFSSLCIFESLVPLHWLNPRGSLGFQHSHFKLSSRNTFENPLIKSQGEFHSFGFTARDFYHDLQHRW